MQTHFERSWGHVADADLRGPIERRDLAAVGELYRRYGTAAYNVALLITHDGKQAEQAVVTAFVRLTTQGDHERRTLRVDLFDEVRSSAFYLADESTTDGDAAPDAGDAGAVFRGLAPSARAVLALALAGRCDLSEIAQVVGRDASAVRRTLGDALDHAASVAVGDRHRRRAGTAPD